MADKHYNINYLENTALILKSIKENSYKPLTGIREGRIFDLGCGTGIDAVNLAGILGTKVTVTGVDHDEAMIGKARASSDGVPNVNFVVSEVYPIQAGDGSVDGVRAERLLQHLADPDKLIAEAYRILKPGSPLVIVETDWSSLSFYNTSIETEKKVGRYLTDVKVKNGAVARELTSLMKASGFEEIRIDIYPFVVRSVSEIFMYLLIDQSLKEMRDKGYLTGDEYTHFLDDMDQAESAGYFACTINLVIASATKR